MARHIVLNAFDMNCVGHIQHGMWTHPRDRSVNYNTLEYHSCVMAGPSGRASGPSNRLRKKEGRAQYSSMNHGQIEI